MCFYTFYCLCKYWLLKFILFAFEVFYFWFTFKLCNIQKVVWVREKSLKSWRILYVQVCGNYEQYTCWPYIQELRCYLIHFFLSFPASRVCVCSLVQTKCRVWSPQNCLFFCRSMLYSVEYNQITKSVQYAHTCMFERLHWAKMTIHKVITMLATSKNALYPGHSHLLTTGTDDSLALRQ